MSIYGLMLRLAVLLFVKANSALAAPQAYLYPVEIIGYEGIDLRLNLLVPCRGEFLGLVAREVRGGSLELAAAIRLDSVVCTNVPQAQSIKVNFIDVHRFKSIAAMNLSVPLRLELRAVESLDAEVTGDSGVTVLVSSRGRCGQQSGALLRPSKSGDLYVGVVDFPRRSTYGATSTALRCPIDVRQSVIHALAPATIKRLRPYHGTRRHMMRQYELRFAPVDRASLTSSPDGSKVIRYFRGCQDAPVGLVTRIHSKRPIDAVGTTYIGVLVARYFNAPCHEQNKGEWVATSLKDLALPQHARLDALMELQGDDMLTLKSPLTIETLGSAPENGGNTHSMAYLASCDHQDLYMVHARNRHGKDVVGLVARIKAGAAPSFVHETRRCLGEPKVSWHSFQRPKSADVYPLILPQ